MKIVIHCCVLALGLVTHGSRASEAPERPLSLAEAVALAGNADPWLQGSRYREQALREQAVAAGTLPDPTVSLSAANLPVDSFDTQQEPMTQLKLGVSQMFPRGQSRALQRRKLEQTGDQLQLLRDDRRAALAMQVSMLWLEWYRYSATVNLIERDRSLFEQLVDVAGSAYRNALGRSRQQDLVRAQLELTRLEDRLSRLQQQQNVSARKLAEWLPSGIEMLPVADLPILPEPVLPTSAELLPRLNQHPKIASMELQIQAGTTAVELAQQNYKPQWGVNAAYALRDDDLMGRERSDFFSLGVSLDVPLFTGQRQDRQLAAARASREALKTDKALALRALRAGMESARATLQNLEQRRALFDQRLLRQAHDQAEAALNAYTNDDANFAEAIHARIVELDANIDYLNIQVDRLKAISELNYYLAGTAVDAVPRNGYIANDASTEPTGEQQ